MGHAVFVFGAAGAGKTTFCRNLKENGLPSRNIHLINLDPAQEDGTGYDINLCDHITVGDVMENLDFGPNGALFYALQETCANLEALELHTFEGDYIVFDCPGQIELFLHSDLLIKIVEHVQKFARVAIAYLTDATNFITGNKHIYSALCATLSMYRFNLPILNILSKADLVDDEKLEAAVNALTDVNDDTSEYGRLNASILEYVENNGMLNYLSLNWYDDNSVQNVYMQLDILLQRLEDVETKESKNEE
ncbi:GPN-loop GTPase [Enteropsectra breve]|nr:GPN-loop GTPase [Enteropsectra breve]